jgi:hypothetical protein
MVIVVPTCKPAFRLVFSPPGELVAELARWRIESALRFLSRLAFARDKMYRSRELG